MILVQGEEEPKLCKDCKHYKYSRVANTSIERCGMFVIFNPVNGRKQSMECSDARYAESALCGEQGNCWEVRVEGKAA